MPILNGKYTYQSYCPRQGSTAAPAELVAPWAGPAELQAATDAAGNITATLTFRPGIALKVSGRVTPATGGLPEGIDLNGEGLGAVYRIRGYSVAGRQDLIVGTVIVVQGTDPALQPLGTHGPFVLLAA